MTSSRTPGPWELYGQDSLNVRGRRDTQDSFDHVAYCGAQTIGRAQANARVIAAAPDMIEALGDALIAMGKAGANHDLNHPQRKAWEACRAAIVKATHGVQP